MYAHARCTQSLFGPYLGIYDIDLVHAADSLEILVSYHSTVYIVYENYTKILNLQQYSMQQAPMIL